MSPDVAGGFWRLWGLESVEFVQPVKLILCHLNHGYTVVMIWFIVQHLFASRRRHDAARAIEFQHHKRDELITGTMLVMFADWKPGWLRGIRYACPSHASAAMHNVRIHRHFPLQVRASRAVFFLCSVTLSHCKLLALSGPPHRRATM